MSCTECSKTCLPDQADQVNECSQYIESHTDMDEAVALARHIGRNIMRRNKRQLEKIGTKSNTKEL